MVQLFFDFESRLAFFFAMFGLYGSVFGHFLGVRGVAQCGSMAQNMPLGPLDTGEQKNLLAHNF